jgi:hypothetical protein
LIDSEHLMMDGDGADRFGAFVDAFFDRSVPRDEEWLLVECPTEEKRPTKFWLAVPENAAFDRLVELAKLRRRIERDYQELKQELGLGHFDGRGWRGFHHHATLCIVAYAFLVAEGENSPLRTDGSPRGRRFDPETTCRSDRSVTSRTQSPPFVAP